MERPAEEPGLRASEEAVEADTRQVTGPRQRSDLEGVPRGDPISPPPLPQPLDPQVGPDLSWATWVEQEAQQEGKPELTPGRTDEFLKRQAQRQGSLTPVSRLMLSTRTCPRFPRRRDGAGAIGTGHLRGYRAAKEEPRL